MELITKFIVKKVFDEAYSLLKNGIKKEKQKFDFSKSDIEHALNVHLKYVDTWSKEIKIKDMLKSKKIGRVYIGLNLSIAPRKLIPKDHKVEKTSILKIMNNDSHIILTGDPGAGKTTTLKYLCQKLIFEDLLSLKKYNFPILIPLRNLSENESIYDRLRDIFGIHIYWGNKEIHCNKDSSDEAKRFLIKILNDYIDTLNVLLLIDGLDELMPLKAKRELGNIKELAANLKNSKMVVTCRSGAYNVEIDNASVYEICALNTNQIKTFCNKWFENKQDAKSFLSELSRSPLSDTANRPLILTLLCSIYSKYKRLPNKPKLIYNKIIRLLIEDWDVQREIKRQSNYEPIESDKIFDFLIKFAFELTVSYSKKEYSYNEIVTVLNDVFDQFEISIIQLENFILDIETQNGIFLKSSYDTFEFFHKSIQEYLSAEYILRLPQVPIEVIQNYILPNELAIAVCLSSNPTVYFCNLVLNIFSAIEKNIEGDQYGITNGKIISMFLERLLIESPDFEKSSFLAYVFLFMDHYYNLGNPTSIMYISEECGTYSGNFIENFQYLFGKLKESDAVKKSFELLKENIIDRKVHKDEFGSVFLELTFDKAFYLRNFDVSYDDLEERLFVNKKIFQPLL